MLKILRKKGVAKKLIWAIAIVIIISFGFLGTAYLITDQFSQNYAGRIFGRKISLQDYQKAFQQVQNQAIMRYGDNFQNVRQFLDFDSETWDRLILLHEARRRNIKVSDQDVVETVASLPFFQRDSQFDTLLYNDILRFYFKMRPHEFEESVRADLKIQKIVENITKDITVTDDDAFAKYKEQNDKVQVQYIVVDPAPFIKDAPFNEAKSRAIYQSNPAAFEKAPSINVNYLRFPFPEEPAENLAKQTNPEDPEVLTPKEPDAVSASRKQAEDVYLDIQNGMAFEEAAAKHNVAARETGFFSANQPDLSPGWSFNTLNYLFQAEPGESLGPIKTENAFLVVQLKEHQKAATLSYEEAREQVRELALKESAREIAALKAQEYRLALLNHLRETPGAQFADAAAQLNIEVQITPAFNRGQYLPKVGISQEFQNAAFGLDENNRTSEIVTTAIGPAILYLDEAIPADREQFEKDKTAFKETLLAQETNKAFSEFLTQLRLEAKLQDNIAKLRQQQEQQQSAQ